MNNTPITIDDMYDAFSSFRISHDLYEEWREYAQSVNKTMKAALTELLQMCPPSVYYITALGKEERVIVMSNLDHKNYREFTLKYNKPLKEEIFKIFMQTKYRNRLSCNERRDFDAPGTRTTISERKTNSTENDFI